MTNLTPPHCFYINMVFENTVEELFKERGKEIMDKSLAAKICTMNGRTLSNVDVRTGIRTLDNPENPKNFALFKRDEFGNTACAASDTGKAFVCNPKNSNTGTTEDCKYVPFDFSKNDKEQKASLEKLLPPKQSNQFVSEQTAKKLYNNFNQQSEIHPSMQQQTEMKLYNNFNQQPTKLTKP